MGAAADEAGGRGITAAAAAPSRTRCGVIALTPGHTHVALVRPKPGGSDASNAGEDGSKEPAASGGWQFPSAPSAASGRPGEVERLEAQLATALGVADSQLGIDVGELLCSQPVIHALGPEPKSSTKFFMAFNVPQGSPLQPAAEGAEAAWHDLQELLESTAEQAVAGNQLVAVLRQLQGMIKRRYEMVMPADDGYQEVASLMSWHEAVQAGEAGSVGVAPWRGMAPKQFLEEHCKAHQFPAPCFNVFEHDRTAAGRTHFCATCMLPHLGLQLTPDAVYPSPLDAMENVAVLAVLYLLGALGADCPLVHFAPAGEMAQVPHAFATEFEHRLDSRKQQGDLDKKKRELERQVEEEQAALQRRLEELRRQQEMLAAGELPPGLQAGAAAAAAGGPAAAQGPGPGLGAAAGPGAVAQKAQRPPKRLRPDKGPLTVGQALQDIPRDKHALMAIKELCDKCRFALPSYEEVRMRGGAVSFALSLPEAGVPRTVGPPHEDPKQAKLQLAQAVMDGLWRKHLGPL